MVLIEDTRNQVGKHNNISIYCSTNGITLIRRKLEVGDYMIEGKQDISVDTKNSLLELCSDLSLRKIKGVNKDGDAPKTNLARFYRECGRAYASKIKLIILIEEAPIYRELKDIAYWKSPRTKISGTDLLRKIKKCHSIFGTEFILTTRSECPKRLIELLKNGNI